LTHASPALVLRETLPGELDALLQLARQTHKGDGEEVQNGFVRAALTVMAGSYGALSRKTSTKFFKADD
jgi:NaMN:DMB phosphoribosyltransferase